MCLTISIKLQTCENDFSSSFLIHGCYSYYGINRRTKYRPIDSPTSRMFWHNIIVTLGLLEKQEKRSVLISNMILPTVYWPEETLPGGEVGALEECMLQYTLHSSEGLYHVCPVVVQVPQLAIMTLVSPPERVLFQHLQHQRHSW